MLRFTLSFPLGVYHAQLAGKPNDPEWPPSPLRLIGALLAAAHGRTGADPAPARALIQRLCDAAPPRIVAPECAPAGEQEPYEVAALRGATRWAPRNYVDPAGISPRNLGRERAAVSKVGVAIGTLPVEIVWEDVALDAGELETMRALAEDVTFVGTSRSPAIVTVSDRPLEDSLRVWEPAEHGAEEVRVPDRDTVAAFDQREASRSTNGRGIKPTGLIPQIAIGRRTTYRSPLAPADRTAIDPQWWGEMIVLGIDPAASDLVPKAPAGYLVARAVRAALLASYGEAGTPDEAPTILTGRGEDPHCAFVPLPNVWSEYADGRILGIAIVLPHPRRLTDLAAQRNRLLSGIRTLVPGGDGTPRQFVALPGAGELRLAAPSPQAARTITLRPRAYTRPARVWESVTPIVHSRWRKGDAAGAFAQVAADCRHVGLPEPIRVERLDGPGRRGGAARLPALARVPERWRGPLQGPSDHLRLTFARPVAGPILLGKARHFGVGLCVPADTRGLEEPTGEEA